MLVPAMEFLLSERQRLPPGFTTLPHTYSALGTGKQEKKASRYRACTKATVSKHVIILDILRSCNTNKCCRDDQYMSWPANDSVCGQLPNPTQPPGC